MEGTAIKMPGKRLILPKVSSASKSSMSLKNIKNPEISKRCLNNSKGKVIVRIADPGASNSAKKSLPTKPKNFTSQVQDITNQQIVIVDANNISQSQIADAESNNSVPARNPLTYKFVVANDFIDAEKAIADETNCTNTETDTIDYYTDKDSHQGSNQQPGRQLMNSNPFLSDFNSLELINDIDSFNTVSTQEDPEKDKVIAEAYIPVVDNNKKPNMDDDIFFSWGAESLMNCDVPMSDDPMNPMTMVNPVEVEGRNFAVDEMESESATNSSIITENQPASTQEAAGDEVVTEKEMEDIVKNLDDEFIASILQDIEITNDARTNLNDVPAEEETDLLKMVMDDSIGTETMAQFCSSQPDCLTVNLLDINVPNESNVAQLASVGESEKETASVETTPVTTPARRGPGRPRKPRTECVAKRRGRPAKVYTSSENTNEHHNYDSSSTSTAERRYRRMRDLNNVASQRCRLKRKLKMQNAIDELQLSEEKNTELKMKVRILEEQVKTLKKHFINKISNPEKKVIVVPSPDTVWNAEQFESFVNDTIDIHNNEKPHMK